jgi:hypothetical protein
MATVADVRQQYSALKRLFTNQVQGVHERAQELQTQLEQTQAAYAELQQQRASSPEILSEYKTQFDDVGAVLLQSIDLSDYDYTVNLVRSNILSSPPFYIMVANTNRLSEENEQRLMTMGKKAVFGDLQELQKAVNVPSLRQEIETLERKVRDLNIPLQESYKGIVREREQRPNASKEEVLQLLLEHLDTKNYFAYQTWAQVHEALEQYSEAERLPTDSRPMDFRLWYRQRQQGKPEPMETSF